MGEEQDKGLRELYGTATRPPPQAPPQIILLVAADSGKVSVLEDPRRLKRSYEEFADERLVVDVGSAEYDALQEIHNSGRGLHTVWPTPLSLSLFHCFDLG